ncbi:hypothetical protein BU25DRAFT_79650 [Macroventuria anomochaeta]|uniref:Uncharacterized protein n=1 Tax=Macroventuria anomochaeta TaxID=301207 RepID=A0ACB6SF89_9PLEO|nr:uncharacterized protein BU25DRAFT_79650 [Macroventuria anomochaeta]KAF2632658.1 hypothetical protein BU25DRAFT_79650 [Macroventuria anomochaeta]
MTMDFRAFPATVCKHQPCRLPRRRSLTTPSLMSHDRAKHQHLGGFPVALSSYCWLTCVHEATGSFGCSRSLSAYDWRPPGFAKRNKKWGCYARALCAMRQALSCLQVFTEYTICRRSKIIQRSEF